MLGEILRHARQSRGLSQKQLAEKLFIAPCTLSHYETNTRMIPHLTFAKALKLLNYQLNVLDCKTGKIITDSNFNLKSHI